MWETTQYKQGSPSRNTTTQMLNVGNVLRRGIFKGIAIQKGKGRRALSLARAKTWQTLLLVARNSHSP